MNTLELPTTAPAAAVRQSTTSGQPLTGPAASAHDPLKLTSILVPTDFSGPAQQAVRYAVRMAEEFGATLTLVHVFELPAYAQGLPDYPTVYLRGEDFQRIYDEAQSQATERVNAVRDGLRSALPTVNALVRRGTPHEEIVGAAKETGTDLIVIATHGHTGLKHFFLGSTTERVVRHAPCPVLVVRNPEDQDADPTAISP